MLGHVAARAHGHEIPKRIIALLASFRLMMDLQVFQRPASLTSPVVALEHPLHAPSLAEFTEG